MPTATEGPDSAGAALVAQALERQRAVLEQASQIYVGYSGGADSTALLHAAARLFPDRVTALHANHNLHGDAQGWQRHCASCCSAWGIPLRSRELTVTPDAHGIEAAARDARYAWFASELDADDLLLLAHHQDDQVETLLLRLLRGSGLQGLAGMPERRRLGDAQLLRPLLDLPRSALQSYVREQALAWVEDPGNADRRFDRSYLRRDVLPLLEQRWPGYRRTFSRATRQVRAALQRMPAEPPPLTRSVVGDPGLALATLPGEPEGDALALRAWLRAGGLPMPTTSAIEEFLRQLRDGAGARLALGGWVLERYRNHVYCYLQLPAPAQVMAVDPRGSRVERPGLGAVEVFVDGPGSPAVALSLRFRRGGERLRMPDGRHQSLKKCFQALALPPWWRDRIPLLFAGDELMLLGPLRRAAHPLSKRLRLRWDPPLPGDFAGGREGFRIESERAFC